MSEKLLSEEALIEEQLSLEPPIKPYHVPEKKQPEPPESDDEFSPEFVMG